MASNAWLGRQGCREGDQRDSPVNRNWVDGAGGILVTRHSLASFPDYFVNPWAKMFPLWNKGNLVQKKLAAGAPHDPPPLATAHHLGRVMGFLPGYPQNV